jgi:hypothetical protein
VAAKLSRASDRKVFGMDPARRVKVVRDAAGKAAGVGVPLTVAVIYVFFPRLGREGPTKDNQTKEDRRSS